MAETTYTPLRHAPVEGDPDVLWVVIARWAYEDGTTEWALEYWNERNPADQDAYFNSQAEAEAQAANEFGIGEDDWQDGPQPRGARRDSG